MARTFRPCPRAYRDGPTRPPAGQRLAALVDCACRAASPRFATFCSAARMIESLGSNNWVVDGTLSATGKPLLANDPHLGTQAAVHLVSRAPLGRRLRRDRRDAARARRRSPSAATASSPGARPTSRPTSRISIVSGSTTAGTIRRPSAARRSRSTIVPETIRVKGGEPVQLRCPHHPPRPARLRRDQRQQRRAPTPSGPKPAPLAPLALRWTALDADDTTLAAFLKLNEARNWSDFTAALRDFVVPSQNFVYGDVDGHIGYYAPGRIPIRARGDGSLPVDGWTGDANGPDGFRSTSCRTSTIRPNISSSPPTTVRAGSGYPYTLGSRLAGAVSEPTRITELLRGRTKLTPDDFARIQADTVSLHAKALLPLLLQHARPDSAADTQALDILRQWDADARGDSARPRSSRRGFSSSRRRSPATSSVRSRRTATPGRFSFVTRFLVNTLTVERRRRGATTCGPRRPETCDDGGDDGAARCGRRSHGAGSGTT